MVDLVDRRCGGLGAPKNEGVLLYGDNEKMQEKVILQREELG